MHGLGWRMGSAPIGPAILPIRGEPGLRSRYIARMTRSQTKVRSVRRFVHLALAVAAFAAQGCGSAPDSEAPEAAAAKTEASVPPAPAPSEPNIPLERLLTPRDQPAEPELDLVSPLGEDPDTPTAARTIGVKLTGGSERIESAAPGSDLQEQRMGVRVDVDPDHEDVDVSVTIEASERRGIDEEPGSEGTERGVGIRIDVPIGGR